MKHVLSIFIHRMVLDQKRHNVKRLCFALMMVANISCVNKNVYQQIKYIFFNFILLGLNIVMLNKLKIDLNCS